LTDAYFLLKENFIAENDTAINATAKKLMLAADSLLFKELKADSSIIETATSFTQSLSAELKGLIGEKVLLQKRKSFNVVTDLVYNLIRTVQYDREVVYYQRCPMAFEEGDPNAFWLSKSSDIRNPYHPKTMLTCGEVIDSLKYIP
jgi:Cu(I)/Ag(I) efflux system membrane fusion protein